MTLGAGERVFPKPSPPQDSPPKPNLVKVEVAAGEEDDVDVGGADGAGDGDGALDGRVRAGEPDGRDAVADADLDASCPGR